MNDYISREAARDLMYHKQDALTEYDLNSIPAADVEPVRRWTACSERLPEPGERVLATDGGRRRKENQNEN